MRLNFHCTKKGFCKKVRKSMGKNNFLRGIKDGLPICFGYFSVAFAFGIFAVGSGLKGIEAVLISLTNVTSAGQLAAVPVILSGGTMIEMATSQFIINLRYSLMSVSLSQKFGKDIRLIDRFILAFVNTDEVFAVASSNKGMLKRSYMYGLILTPYVGWGLGTVVGAVAGDVLPKIITSSLGIAIYGMFIAIVLPAAKESKPTLLCVAIAVLIGCLFRYLPFLSAVPEGFVIIIATVVASGILAFLHPVEVQEADEND